MLRFSSIGDIVLCSPVLRCLHNQIPGSEIHFLTKKKYSGLLEHNPHVAKVIGFEKHMSSVFPVLARENYDVVIDLHHNLRTMILKLRLSKPSFSFQKLNLRKWLWVNWKLDKMPEVHIVDRYLKTVSGLGVKDDGKGLDFFPCDCDSVGEEDFPEEMRNLPFVAFSIGGTHFTKKMPIEKWIELGSEMPIPMVIIGGKEDMEAAWQLAENLRQNGKKVWNAAGQFSIDGSAHLLKKACLVISHDTGMMHLAAAFQKPIVAIWGNTSPKLGMYPFRTSSINLEVKDLACRPCSKIGFSKCPKGHFACMNQQNLQSNSFWDFIHSSIEKHLLES